MRIHEYARNGDCAGVQRELAAAEHVDARHPETDLTPLAEAAASPHGTAEVLRLLLEQGADPNALCGRRRKKSVFLMAVEQWDVIRLATLLEAGADIGFQSDGGYDAMISCFFQKGARSDPGLLDTVEFLIENGAPLDGESKHGESALRVASRLGRFDAIRRLLDAEADATPLRWTELHRAVALGSLEDVERHASDRAALEAKDGWDRTPWLLSIQAGEFEKAKLLASAGSDRSARGRCGKHPLLYAAEGGHHHVLDWLLSEGAAVDEMDDSRTTALMEAAHEGDTVMVERLLRAGANPRAVDEFDHTVMRTATTLPVMRLLQAAGADFADIGSELRQALTGLDPQSLRCAPEDFHAGRKRRFGSANPERMDTPFWRAMVAARAHAWDARSRFIPEATPTEPVWCYARYGQSITELGDGRIVEVGGEHEDWYDPDFCIYNDVVVYDGAGDFSIYGYPRDLFPPTDFHSATLFDGWIYLIGSLGYREERVHGRAQVFRLSTTDFHMERVETSGDDPGWISRHRAHFRPPSSVYVSGGKVETGREYSDNDQDYLFDFRTHTWSRIQP